MDTDASSPADPTNPTDTRPTHIEGALDPPGPTGQFQVVVDGMLRCLTCRRTFSASSQHAGQAARLEGASDPADMLIIVPLRCPHSATTGTVTLGYGPLATEEDADVLRAIDLPADRRGDATEARER